MSLKVQVLQFHFLRHDVRQATTVRIYFLYLKEKHGGSGFHCAVINHILVSKVLKSPDGDMFVVGVKHGVEVAKVAGQKHYSKEPPDGADYTSRQSFRVRAGT